MSLLSAVHQPGRGTPSRPPATLAALLLVAVLSPVAVSAQSLLNRKPQGYVTDAAGVLSPGAREQLTALCTEVDQKTKAQIAVVTVQTTGDQPIQDYAIDLATKWGVGPKESNRGVMILLAVKDHKYWTLVGYGLEGILPDGKVGGFGREAVPLLRQGNYDGALLLMTRRVADVIAQDSGVALSGRPIPQQSTRSESNDGVLPMAFWILFFVVMAFLAIARSSSRSTRRGGGWWLINSGGGFGGGGFGGGGGGGGGGFGGFGGGSFGGGGAGGSW